MSPNTKQQRMNERMSPTPVECKSASRNKPFSEFMEKLYAKWDKGCYASFGPLMYL